ncbi:MAG: response regulator [Methanobacterium sp.]|uniref:response regulator n=1 Tax=Methanobacterium sp. TaxID=2164 RepID=UPI003D64E4D3|nr:response regulator [Methanobacterium sp.]
MTKNVVLVVEDERVVAMDIVSRLENMGYEVPKPASTGKDAIKLALEVKPDIILMDIVIKGSIDGIEAAKRINNLFDIPIIFVTAYSDDEIIQRAKKTVPYGYIIKPFEDRDLYSMIEVSIYKHEKDRKSKKNKEKESEAQSS